MTLTSPVTDPAAWKAADIELQSCVFEFSSAHIAEIEAALEGTSSTEVELLTRTALDCPTLAGSLAEHVHSRLEGGRGFCLLRGLPVKRWGEQRSRRALWLIGVHLGTPEKQDGAGSMIHDVKDHHASKASDLAAAMTKDSSIRGFQTNAALPFHTDGCDAFALMCISQGRQGGSTSIVSAVEAFNQIVTTRPDLAEVLQRDWHFDARGQRADGERCQVHPIYTYHQGRLNIIHKQPYILSAQAHPEVPRLSALQKEALRVLENTLSQKSLAVELSLQPGEVVVCSNHCCVHGRTAFEDHPEPGQPVRHMLRLWLSLPANTGRALPPHYAGTREHCDTFARRCQPAGSCGGLVAPPALVALVAALVAAQARTGALGEELPLRVQRAACWLLWLPVVYWVQLGAQWLHRGFPALRGTTLREPSFSWRSFFLLCFSESFSMIAVAAILWHGATIGLESAVLFVLAVNAVGYLKYLYQMFVDPEYVTLSFHCYTAAWLWVALSLKDPVYFVLFRYPFHLLGKIEQYMNMKGRKILLDEAGITLHVVDHLLHGFICCRVLLYHFWGFQTVLFDVMSIPFCLLLSENLVRMQDPNQQHKLA